MARRAIFLGRAIGVLIFSCFASSATSYAQCFTNLVACPSTPSASPVEPPPSRPGALPQPSGPSPNQVLQNNLMQMGVQMGTQAIINGIIQQNEEAEAAAARARAEEAAAAQARDAEEVRRTDAMRDRLLGQIQGVDAGAPARTAATPVSLPGSTQFFGLGGNPLPLMQDDDTASAAPPPAPPPPPTPDAAPDDGNGGNVAQASPDAKTADQTKVKKAAASPAPRRSTVAQPVIATWTMPLLRPAQDPNGHPVDDGRPSSTCMTLAEELQVMYDTGRLAVLAGDAYSHYDSKKAGTPGAILPLAMTRVSDDPALLRKLLPGANPQTVRELLAPPGSDYRAEIYQDQRDPKRIYLVFRGTVTLRDWLENYRQQTGQGSQYVAKAIALAKLLKTSTAANGMQLEIVGHSLGGAMADAAGAVNQVRTTSFNPEGVHPGSLPPGFDLAAARSYLTDVVVAGEPLTTAQDHNLTAKAALAAMAAGAGGPAAGMEVGAANADSLVPAIGPRVTLPPDPGDTYAKYDPVRLHYMTSVASAISYQFSLLYDQYRHFGCVAPGAAQ